MSKSSQQPWISIVTVVKDDPSGFDRTRVSISNQSLKDYEWVVVDSSREPLTKLDNIKYSWTDPQGIYPAMNLGIEQSTGEYVYFLNAGDTFSGPNSLEMVLPSLTGECDALVAEVLFINERGKEIAPTPINLEKEALRFFASGRFPPHQGLIVRRSLLASLGGFDTAYKVAADFDLFLRLSQTANVCSTPVVMARFHVGGKSSQSWVLAQREFHRARMRELGLSFPEKVHALSLECLEFLKQTLAHLARRT